MSQGEEVILLPNRKVVAGVILMVMSIDNGMRMKFVYEFQKSISAKSEARIDQEPINKKGIHLIKRKA